MFKRFEFKFFDALVTIRISINPIGVPGQAAAISPSRGLGVRLDGSIEDLPKPRRKKHKGLTYKPFEKLPSRIRRSDRYKVQEMQEVNFVA